MPFLPIISTIKYCKNSQISMETKSNFWKKWSNPLFLFIFYVAAHFLLLVSKVIMWDGWLWTSLLKQKNYTILYQMFSQARLLHIYYIYRIFDALGDPVTMSNISVFISWLIAGICVYFILKNFTGLGEKNAFFVAAIFLLSPIFMVRFQIALVTYSLSNMAFFLGAYLFLQAGAAPPRFSKIILQILAAIFFIAAYFTASFLVFYGALIIFYFLQRKSGASEPESVWAFFKKNIFWILLPVIFYWAHQKFIGAPYGLYKGYNSFVFSGPGISIFKVLSILIDRSYQFAAYGFFWPIIFSVSVLQNKIFLAIFLFFSACIFFLNKKFNFLSSKDDNGKTGVAPKKIFIWGVLLFIFAAGAYILVGESPNPYGSRFDMRHGLILPLGVSLIILAFINGLLKNKAWKAVKIIILAVFLTFNIYNYYTVDMDWYKQLGVIQGVREKYSRGQIGEKDILVFYDKVPLYSWRGRQIPGIEYTAYLYEATGNDKLMGSGVGGDLQLTSAIKNDEFGNDATSTAKRIKNVIITSEPKQEPSVKNWLKLKAADLFLGKAALQSAIKNFIGVGAEITTGTPRETSWADKLPKIK